MVNICTIHVPELKVYDPEIILSKANISWNSIDSFDAKAVVASRDLFNKWKDIFVKVADDQNPEELWQSIGPMVDDSLQAGTVCIDISKITIAQTSDPASAPPMPTNMSLEPDQELVLKDGKWVVRKKVQANYSKMFEYIENGEDFEDIKSNFTTDIKELYASAKRLYDSIYEFPRAIIAQVPPELQGEFEKAGLDTSLEMSLGMYAAMDILNQLKQEKNGIPLTRQLAQKPAAVMMLEHLANNGYVRKDLKSPSEVMPNAKVPVYTMSEAGEKLLEVYNKAPEYKDTLTKDIGSLYNNLHSKYVTKKTQPQTKQIQPEPIKKEVQQKLDSIGQKPKTEVKPGEPDPNFKFVSPEAQEIAKIMEEAEKGLKGITGSLRTAKVLKKQNSWYLYSKDGEKKLGGPYKSREQALKRMRQVEFFKHKKGNMKYKAIFRKHPELKEKSAWLIYDNDKPVMTITAQQAFGESKNTPNEIVENWEFFSSDEYGKELVNQLDSNGLDSVVKASYDNNCTLIKRAQVEKIVPITFSKNEIVRDIPSGKIGKVVDNKGEWYCVNYGDIIDYTMAELLEKVDSSELQTGHNRELAGKPPARPQEYNISKQYDNRIKDLPETEKRDLKSGDIAMADRSKVENQPLAHDMKKKAQIPAPAGDIKVGQPPASEPSQADVAPNAAAQPQAPAPALTTPEAQQKMEGSQYPAALPISEVVTQILASLIAASNEWTVAQAMEEFKNIFTNQRELDLLQGRLIEMEENIKQRSKPHLTQHAMKFLRKIVADDAGYDPVTEMEKSTEEVSSGKSEFTMSPSTIKVGDFVLLDLDGQDVVGSVENVHMGDRGASTPFIDVKIKVKSPETKEGYVEELFEGVPSYKVKKTDAPSKLDPQQQSAYSESMYVPESVGFTPKSPTVVEQPGEKVQEGVELLKLRQGEDLMKQVIENLEEIPSEEWPPMSKEEQDLTEEEKKKQQQLREERWKDYDVEHTLRRFEEGQKQKHAKLMSKIASLGQESTKDKQAIESLNKEKMELITTNATLSKENTSLKQVNAQLSNKVTVMYKLPRAKRLAQKMMDCFITNKDQTDELLKLSDEQFMAREHEVNDINKRLQAKLASVQAPAVFDGESLITSLPGIQQEEKIILPSNSGKSSELFNGIWSRPGTSNDSNNE